MRSIQEIWSSIKSVALDFQWITVIELILFFFVIYFVIRTLYENNAKRFIFVYIFLMLCMGAVTLFSLKTSVLWFFLFVLILSLFFLILFTVEIKRGIWNAGKSAQHRTSASPVKQTVASQRADEYVNGIGKAVQNLSKSNTGALIVLSNGNLPKDIIESGVLLNASISSQLIEGIFIPKAPLHDGAMIIYGDKIQAAGCFLPLTQKDFPKDYGTRHRAGIGVTEVADVAAIIVSEETGIVSYVKRGEITRYVDSVGLKRFLKEYYWKEFNAEGKRS